MGCLMLPSHLTLFNAMERMSPLSHSHWEMYNLFLVKNCTFSLPSATKLRRLCFHRCVSVHRGGGCYLGPVWGGLQAHTQGGSLGESVWGACSQGCACSGGCLLQGGCCSGGCGLLLWSSIMPFYYGLLVWWPSDWRWPSGMVFGGGGSKLSTRRP